MLAFSARLCAVILVLFACLSGSAQNYDSPFSGEITVKLTEGMDSTTDPNATSHGQVVKSTNPAIPKGTPVLVGIGSDPVNGGYTAKMLQITLGGKTMPAASSTVALAADAIGKIYEFTRAKGQPKDAVSGSRVFLPTQTVVRFTLTSPPPMVAAHAPPPPVQAPVAPRHPASNIVDLPPAFPGAPPLHASREANDGCWWVPFGSKSLGYELPVQHCSDPVNDADFQDLTTGLGFSFKKGDPISPGFLLLSKPTTQTVEANIKTALLKTGSDRTVCTVVKGSKLGDLQSYGVTTRSKRTNCAGLYEDDSDATESTSFFSNLSEDNTKYIQFKGEAIVVYPFDLQALHFIPNTPQQ